MHSVRVLCVGKLKERYWREACAEYAKRLQMFCRFTICELPEHRLPERPSGAEVARALEEEGKQLLKAAEGSVLVALCIEGKPYSSEELAGYLESLGVQGRPEVSFLIGSSYGLSEQVKKQACLRLSMSPMTFPHQLARVMVCEQVYRAFQILGHGKYHK